MINKIPDKYIPYIFVAPWVIGFLLFSFLPLLATLRYSFNQVTVTASGLEMESVGLANYSTVIFSNPEVTQAMTQLFFSLLVFVPLVIIFSLVIALLLNKGIKGTSVFRMIFFLPVIIMSGTMLEMLIDNNIMVLPSFVALSEEIAQSGTFLLTLMSQILNSFVFILWCTGVPALIFLSGLQKMNTAVYEAAEIDGATGWESFWKITFPNLKPMILINILYTTIFIATLSLNPIIEAIEKNLFKVETGVGVTSALSWIYFVMIVIVLLILGGAANGGFRKKNK